MAEEVTHVVEFRARLQQAAGKLSTQIMKMQVDDADLLACAPPRGLHRRNTLADFISEDKGSRREVLPSGIGTQHLKDGCESLANRHDPQCPSLGLASSQDQRTIPPAVVNLDVLPLEGQQLADTAAC